MKLRFLPMVVLAVSALAQEPRPLQPLVPGKVVKTQLTVGGAAVPIRCDESGNVYGMFDPVGGGGFSSAVTRISAQGQQGPTFDLTVVPNRPERSSIRDFVVAPNGTVYLLVQAFHRTYVAVLKPDGSFAKKIDIEKLGANKLGVFKNGDLLVLGVEPGTPENPNATKPYNALFNEDGKFLKYVEFADDKKLQKAADQGDSDLAPRGPGTGNRAVSLGMTATGTDGEIYSVRFTSPPTVYAVSPAGIVDKRMVIGEPGQILLGFHVAGSKLLMFLGNKPSQTRDGMLIVVNAQSGDEIARYSVPVELGAGFACYDGNQATWLGIREGKLALISADIP